MRAACGTDAAKPQASRQASLLQCETPLFIMLPLLPASEAVGLDIKECDPRGCRVLRIDAMAIELKSSSHSALLYRTVPILKSASVRPPPLPMIPPCHSHMLGRNLSSRRSLMSYCQPRAQLKLLATSLQFSTTTVWGKDDAPDPCRLPLHGPVHPPLAT
jgi:hypothetical protein